MAHSYVLIVTILLGWHEGSVSGYSQTFGSERTCREAGKAVVKHVSQLAGKNKGLSLRWSCVKQ